MRYPNVAPWFLLLSGVLIGCEDDATAPPLPEAPPDWTDVSDSCKAWCQDFVPCTGDIPMPLSECADGCRNSKFPGCDAKYDDMLSCQSFYLAHECASWGAGCAPQSIAFTRCLYDQAECESGPDTCFCRVSPYQDELTSSCHIVSGTPGDAGGAAQGGAAQGGAGEGGAGEGGAASDLVVECQCTAAGKLQSVCQQDSLNCDQLTNCCIGG